MLNLSVAPTPTYTSCKFAIAVVLLLLGVTRGQADDDVQLALQVQHTGLIKTIAYSPDGNRYVTGSWDKTLHIRDGRSDLLISVLRGHSDYVTSAIFSSEGKFIFSGSRDGSIKQWDVASGKIVRTIQMGKEVKAVAILPDMPMLVAATEDELQIWDTDTGRSVRKLGTRQKQSEKISDFRLSPDGRSALIGISITSPDLFKPPTDSDVVELWSVLEARFLRSFDTGEWKYGSVRGAVRVAFSPNGRVVAAGNEFAQNLTAWDTTSGQQVSRIDSFSSSISSLIFSPDSSRLFAAGQDFVGPPQYFASSVKAWDVLSAKLEKRLEPPAASPKRDHVDSIAFSLDGARLIAGGRFRQIYSWRVDTGRLERVIGIASSAVWQGKQNGTFSRDGRRVYWTGDESVRREWDLHSGEMLTVGSTPKSELKVAGSSGFDVLYFATVGQGPQSTGFENIFELTVLNSSAGEKVRSLHGSGVVHAMDVSADGSVVWANPITRKERSLFVWNGQSEEPARQAGATWMEVLKIAPDARKGVSGARGNGEIAEWDLVTGKVIRPLGQHPGVVSLGYSADGTKLVSGGQSSAKIWNLATGKLARSLDGLSGVVRAVEFSSDSRSLMTADSGTIKLWNADNGRLVMTLDGSSQAITSIRFSPAGDRILSLSEDQSSRIWDRNTGGLLATFYARPDGEWIAITPEGFFHSSKGGASLISVVRGLEVQSIDQVYQALYRPDLVREKLAGDPKGLVREAAAKLDLNKVIASGAAPRVSIVTPVGNVGGDEVTVEAQIAEQNGGGIGRIEWRVNGVTLGVESRGLERLPDAGGASVSGPPVVVKRTLALEPGENRIEVVAYNRRNLIASDPAQVVLKWDGEKSATPPKLHVLTVGINDYYDSRLKLSYAVPDARSLGDALKQAGGSLYQSVDVTSVLDDKVTADNLEQVFTDLGKKVHPRDVFVFFLAGHGKTVDGRYHFLPQNFRYEDETSIVKRGIDQERFQAWFAKIPARKSILLYDTCESGSLTGDRVQQRGIERVAALEKMTRAMGRTVLSASSDDAPALEGYRGHGVFTYALLDGLQAADTNGNGLIEVTELAAFVDQKVPDLSYQAFKMRQIPQMKIVGSSFPVVSKTAVLQTSETATSSESVPTKPTHVVISSSPVDVYVAAARGGAVVQRLAPGTTVTLIEGANGWQLVAKDGKMIGYVERKTLLELH